MTKTTLQVFLGDKPSPIGTLIHEYHGNREHSSFKYSNDWLEAPEAFAIAPSLVFNDQWKFFSGKRPFPSPFHDTMPEGWGKKVILHGGHNDKINNLYYLLTVSDSFRVGALRLGQSDGIFLADNEIQDSPKISDITQILYMSKNIEAKNYDVKIPDNFISAFCSLGGAQPKCSIIDNEGSPAILKLGSIPDDLPYVQAEAATLNLAQNCGMDIARGSIISEKNLPAALLLKRFDRYEGKRIPYISAQTFLDAPSADSSAAYTDLADAIRIHCISPITNLKELFKRIAFNILVCNTDDHLKNHGFLYSNHGKWTLSPAFDINPRPLRERKLKTPIASLDDHSASIDLLMEYAFAFDLEKDQAAKITQDMAKVIKDNWKEELKSTGMNEGNVKAFEGAFIHQESKIALKVKSRSIISPT